MTTISFETAQLADALGKANRLAPLKGAAFDKAAGFLLDVNPVTKVMTIRATDLDCTYLQHVPAVSGKGDPTTWRLPSTLFAGMVQSLPLGNDSTVMLTDRGDGFIRLKSGKWMAKLNTLKPEEFPDIPEFDDTDMTPATEFATKVEQVSWATDPKSAVLAGVHMDGTRLIGCNTYALAVVPCEVEIAGPTTVPLASLATILKNATDVKIRSVEKALQIGLDAETQATTRLIEGSYPQVDKVMREDFVGSVTVGKQAFLDALNRMLVLVRTDRMPAIELLFDGTGIVKMLTFDMEVDQVGRMQDTIDVSGDWDGECALHVKPQMLVDAVSHSRDDTVVIAFGHEDQFKSKKLPIRVADSRGYVCYVMPIVKTAS
jgi:DNA polymerase III sliding clamp (beta) subunit (PCNA family)